MFEEEPTISLDGDSLEGIQGKQGKIDYTAHEVTVTFTLKVTVTFDSAIPCIEELIDRDAELLGCLCSNAVRHCGGENIRPGCGGRSIDLIAGQP